MKHLRVALAGNINDRLYKKIEESLLTGICGYRECTNAFTNCCSKCSRLFCSDHINKVDDLPDPAKRLAPRDDDYLCIHCFPKATKKSIAPVRNTVAALNTVVTDTSEHANHLLVEVERLYETQLDGTIAKVIGLYEDQLEKTRNKVEKVYEDQLQKTRNKVEKVYEDQLEKTRDKVDEILVRSAVKIGFVGATAVGIVLFASDLSALTQTGTPTQDVWSIYRIFSLSLSFSLLFGWILWKGFDAKDSKTRIMTGFFFVTVVLVAIGFLSMAGVF